MIKYTAVELLRRYSVPYLYEIGSRMTSLYIYSGILPSHAHSGMCERSSGFHFVVLTPYKVLGMRTTE